MWIRRVAVKRWRGLDFELAELSPHLNLIFGPNEAGKSRLVEAMRFALFESSKGRSEHKKALASWGDTTGKPSVILEFERAGALWRLEKTFLGSGHNTTLRADSVSLEGAEAEDRLAELIGVGQGGRKAVEAKDLGIWSLLWVEQGDSRSAPVHNESSHTRLQDHLTREIGEAAAGELGQELLRRAEAQRNTYYSASRDAERSPLTEPRARVRQLGERLAEARARRDGIAADADALERQRAAERDLVRRAAEAHCRLENMRVQQQRAADLGRQLEVCDAHVHDSERERDRRLEQLERARALDAGIADLERRVAAAAAGHAEAEAARAAAQDAAEEAGRLAAEADRQHTEAERRVGGLHRRRERTRLAEQTEALRDRLREAERVEARVAEVQQALSELPKVSLDDVARIRQLQQARDAAQARLEGASASVELLAKQDIRVAGEALPAGGHRRVLVEDEQQLDVEGVLTITVRPGGGELPKLRDARQDAERALARHLSTLSVADTAAAETIAQRRRDHESELDRCRAEIEHHLPDGREAATDTLRELEAQLDREPVGEAEPFDPEALGAAEAALRDAVTRRDHLRARRDVALERLSDARERAATGKADARSLEREQQEACARREALPADAVLLAEAEQAERTWRERVVARDAMERDFDALGGDDIELELEQAGRAFEQLTRDLQHVRTECTKLAARLEAAGDDGRHERVQELEAELADAELQLARVVRQAAAAKRLHDVLLEEYALARERLTAPVIARIRPYLQSLFPDTEVWLDDDLNLKGLRSPDTDQEFAALSGGAREQLALLVRIGLAEVLGTQEPHPLVLDDVLVNTDAERIRAVQRVLYQASRRMQVLLFTCHGPLFDALGADARIELEGQRRP